MMNHEDSQQSRLGGQGILEQVRFRPSTTTSSGE
jgi:hypothetical protein